MDGERNALKMDLLASVTERGRRPPVSNFAWMEMSGWRSRREEGVKGPRRWRPVKTSSKRMGRPVQSGGGVSMGVDGGMWGGLTVGVGGGLDGGEGVGADDFDEFALEEGVARGRFVSIRWVGMGGITYTNIMPPAPRRIGSITRAPNFRP